MSSTIVSKKAGGVIAGILGMCQSWAQDGAGDVYVFRGEDKNYSNEEDEKELSSGFYRQFFTGNPTRAPLLDPSESQDFDFVGEEKKFLQEAKQHLASGSSNIDVLTELQHYGGKTALVDFTYNPLIALFFACASSVNVPGMVYFFRKDKFKLKKDIVYEDKDGKNTCIWEKDILIEPASKSPRVIFQSSVFVHACHGYVDLREHEGECHEILPAEKKLASDYLEANFNISQDTVYNDIHGFIKNQPQYYRDILNRHKDATRPR